MGSLQDQTCQRLMARLETEQQEALLVPGFRGQRAGIHMVFENLRQGHIPLADFLIPRWLPQIPLDPFTGNPLRYASDEDGITVYAVGKDLSDDGGLELRFQANANFDVGIRLWSPKERKVPALEEQKGADGP